MSELPCIMELEWDTAFFGHRIGRAQALSNETLELVLQEARARAFDCVYMLAQAEDQELYQRLLRTPGCVQPDLRLTLTLSLEEHRTRNVLPVELAHEGDVEVLRTLASQAHRDSRFFADARFDEARCEELYATWIERSVRGWADRVFTARVEGVACGYVTAHIDAQGVGSIGLVAIAPEARGRGFGSRLLAQALDWFAERGVRRVEVVTQGRNVAAQRLYQSAGFRTSQAQVWFHLWH